MKARFAALLLVCVAAAGGAEALGKRPASLFPNLPSTSVQIATATGTHAFSAWIAADDPSRERGLMYVRALPPGQGMLFLFDEPQYAAFWMKNTYLPLDLIFIAKDGQVVNVARGKPHSLNPIPSAGPVTGVLELAAGSAERIGLVPGNRVRWSGGAVGKRSDELVE